MNRFYFIGHLKIRKPTSYFRTMLKQSTLSGFCKSVPIGDNLFINPFRHEAYNSFFRLFSSVRSSNNHPDLLVTHQQHLPFSDHTGPQQQQLLLSESSWDDLGTTLAKLVKTLAYSGTLWHTLAYSVILSHILAYSDILSHILAYSDILWHTLVFSGIL